MGYPISALPVRVEWGHAELSAMVMYELSMIQTPASLPLMSSNPDACTCSTSLIYTTPCPDSPAPSKVTDSPGYAVNTTGSAGVPDC